MNNNNNDDFKDSFFPISLELNHLLLNRSMTAQYRQLFFIPDHLTMHKEVNNTQLLQIGPITLHLMTSDIQSDFRVLSLSLTQVSYVGLVRSDCMPGYQILQDSICAKVMSSLTGHLNLRYDQTLLASTQYSLYIGCIKT